MNSQPLASLTHAVCVLLRLCMAGAILALVVQATVYSRLVTTGVLVEGQFPPEWFVEIVGVSQVVMPLVTYIFFFIWIYRTNSNLWALTSEPLRFTPGWCVGWFFVPFLNFFRPYQVMKEIWQVCHRDRQTVSALLGGWWLLWLVSFMVARVAGLLMDQAQSVTEANQARLLFVGADLLDALKFGFMLAVVTRIWTAYCQNIDDEGLTSDHDAEPE